MNQGGWQKQQTIIDQQVLKEAYLGRFGVEKSELLIQWLALDKAELQKRCKALNIPISGVDDSQTTSQLMQQIFSHLSKFEAQEITKAKQTN